MNKLLLTILLFSIFTPVYSYDCFIDGIFYELDNGFMEATVTYKKESKPTKEYKGDIVIPEMIIYKGDSYKVTAVAPKAFSNCKDITSIAIPNSVIEIGKSAFFGCENLSSIILPGYIKAIREWTFYCCFNLKEIYIPRSVLSIESWALSNCRSLKKLVIPSSVVSIGDHAFANCNSMENLFLSPNLNDIGKNAFKLCDNIKEVIVSERLLAGVKDIFASSPEFSISNIEPMETPPTLEILADSDTDIPISKRFSGNTFALIIANENYINESDVPYANNDGSIFSDYMGKTIGIPEENIIKIFDATLSDIEFGLNRLKNICNAFDGDASVIVYYAGHGVPDDTNHEAYLLPTDGRGSDISSAFPLNQMFSRLSELNSKQTVVFIDACFSGTQRSGKKLHNTRSVRLKPKNPFISGNTIAFSASQGNETAHPYDEQKHGLFTYFILKKLQESCGETTLGELADYVTSNVKQTSALKRKDLQTPNVTPSLSANDWRTWTLFF